MKAPESSRRRRADGSPAGAATVGGESAPPGDAAVWRNREVLVCVCGGISAYKTAGLVSLLVQRGCGVTVAMTRNARRFVGELTFRALSGRAVHTSQWQAADTGDIQHLKLSETADLIIVAPATAHCIGKLAGGLADDLVSGLLLGAACPVLLAPAMNERMWQHPAVQRNLSFLRDSGISTVGPGSGWQACRAVGPGRMSEPEEIASAAAALLGVRKHGSRS